MDMTNYMHIRWEFKQVCTLEKGRSSTRRGYAWESAVGREGVIINV